jgi:hypothetical protein
MPRTEAGIQLERDHFDAADYCGITRPYLSDAIDAIEAEAVAPLRAALEQIVAMDYRGNEPNEQRIARAALATLNRK